MRSTAAKCVAMQGKVEVFGLLSPLDFGTGLRCSLVSHKPTKNTPNLPPPLATGPLPKHTPYFASLRRYISMTSPSTSAPPTP